jgi:ribosome biogenesis SPOUT family RNA methylase Rps3
MTRISTRSRKSEFRSGRPHADGRSRTLFVIEHLEPELSEWLFIEYSHAAELAGRGNLQITNVKRKSERQKLSKICEVKRKRVIDLFPQRELIILDPQARKKLTPSDLQEKRVVVVGGILGDDPPQGRTKEMLTKLLPKARPRNLGKRQLSIDGSIYVAKRVSLGIELGKIPLCHSIEVPIAQNCSVVLPFTYPLVAGKPLISGKLIAYLKHRGADFGGR